MNSGVSYVTSTRTFINYYEPHNQIQVVPQNGKYMAVMNGSLSQTVLNKPGKTYRFTGWFFTTGPAAYYFSLNNSDIFQFSTYSGSGRTSPWVQIAFDFRGSGSDTFTIAANPSGNSIVDNFSIVAVTPTFAGTPGQAKCFSDSVSALTKQYGGLMAAASALGFPSVQALQSAIRAYCGDK